MLSDHLVVWEDDQPHFYCFIIGPWKLNSRVFHFHAADLRSEYEELTVCKVNQRLGEVYNEIIDSVSKKFI